MVSHNKKKKKEPKAKEIKKPGPGIKPCAICKQKLFAKGNILEKAGSFFMQDKTYYFHFFCLLFR